MNRYKEGKDVDRFAVDYVSPKNAAGFRHLGVEARIGIPGHWPTYQIYRQIPPCETVVLPMSIV